MQVGRGVLIGQRACWLMTKARESIDSLRAKSYRLHSCRDKWLLAAIGPFSAFSGIPQVFFTILENGRTMISYAYYRQLTRVADNKISLSLRPMLNERN